MAKDRNIIFENSSSLFMRSTTDGLYILPWRLLHEGYQVSKQETVVSVSPDAGIPITHSRFSVGGRIIAARIYTNTEQDWWTWYKEATHDRALPIWVYDARLDGFMRCYITEQPRLTPANNSALGCYIELALFARVNAIHMKRFVTEGVEPNLIIHGSDGSFVYEEVEASY